MDAIWDHAEMPDAGAICAAVGFPTRATRTARAGGLCACRARGLPQRMAFAVFTLPGAAISMLVSNARLFASPSDEPGVAHQHRDRSEEHTSELQSLTNIVCRLLLVK